MTDALLWITEGGKSSVIAQRRLANLRLQEEKLHPSLYLVVIPQIVNDTLSRNARIKKLLLEKLSCGLRLAPRDDSLVLISQDDAQLCGQFLPELRSLLDEAPEGWRTLHLCPGYMWGRVTNKARLDRDLPSPVPADPDWIVPVDKRVGSRFSTLFEPAWVGGPVAFLIRKRDIESLLLQLRSTNPTTPDDMSLVHKATPNDYMLRKDLLCHEREQGGAQNTHNVTGRVVAMVLLMLCCIAIYVVLTTRITFQNKIRAFFFLLFVAFVVLLTAHTVTTKPTPQPGTSFSSVNSIPSLLMFRQECGKAKLAQCKQKEFCTEALPNPADPGIWLAALETLFNNGGYLCISSTLNAFIPSEALQSSKASSAGVVFCSASLSEPLERFSLLPCLFAPKHIALQRIWSLARCAVSNGILDRNYLSELPESVLCECLTGERRLPSTDNLKQECLEAIRTQEDCCFIY